MTDSAFDIIICGSLHLDIMVDAPHIPRLDETAVGTKWAYKCGGKGGNQAVMSARLGARAAMIGRVGDDDFGTRLLDHLDRGSVDRHFVTRDPDAGSGMSVALINPQGDYGAVIVSGANLNLDPQDTARAFSALGGAPIVILQNEIPDNVNLALARAARAVKARVILNAAPAKPLPPALDEVVDLLVVNRIEAGMLSGQEVRTADEARGALRSLGHERRDVIITLGADGLVVGAQGQPSSYIPATPVTVASTHGAGDCFIGALGLALARGATLATAATQASRLAAHVVSLPEEKRETAIDTRLWSDSLR